MQGPAAQQICSPHKLSDNLSGCAGRGTMHRWKLAGALALTPFLSPAAHADWVEVNVEIMQEAARKLDFSPNANRAYLLVKQETFIAPVAVIFGYGDNASACDALALTLSTSGRDGTFKCQPIH